MTFLSYYILKLCCNKSRIFNFAVDKFKARILIVILIKLTNNKLKSILISLLFDTI